MKDPLQVEYESIRNTIQNECEKLLKEIAPYPDRVFLKFDDNGHGTLEYQKHPYAALRIKQYQERWEKMVDDFNNKWRLGRDSIPVIQRAISENPVLFQHIPTSQEQAEKQYMEQPHIILDLENAIRYFKKQ